MRYDPRHRPAQPPTPAADAFEVRHGPGHDGVSIAYVRTGEGGAPLVLLHGYPETKRIWWRNLVPLAGAGFDVIALDLRGYGDSELPANDQHDIGTYALDVHALVHDHLGLDRCTVAAGDVGGVVAADLTHRFDRFVEQLCVFNTVPPFAADDFAAAGLDLGSFSGFAAHETADYRDLQGGRPDELAAMLTTDAARRQWVAAMYTSRLWGSPGSFTADDVAFMTEPFADEARLRAGWAVYQLLHGLRTETVPAILDRPVEVPTLVLYGPDDHVLREDFLPFSEVAYRNRIGPLVVPGAGHFLQWERADIFNATLAAVFGPR